MRVFLSIGSNLGKREENLKKSVELLRTEPGITVVKVSSFYETEPEGYTEQPLFINAAVEIETTHAPHELLRIVKDIEHRLGRFDTFRHGPRIIDIDIILYGEERVSTPELTIPHPRYRERSFVMKPLLEIAPWLSKTKR